jgi:hypothetical protein
MSLLNSGTHGRPLRLLFSFAFFLLSALTTMATDAFAGTISGLVRDFNSGTPIQGVTVNAYDSNWTLAGSGTTNASGYYTISLPPDIYFLHTSNSLGYVNRFYGQNPTVNSSASRSAAIPIPVLNSDQWADFSMFAGARSISGNVLREGDGAPLPGTMVVAFSSSSSDQSSTYVEWTNTGEDGNYVLNGLYQSASVYVKTQSSQGLVDKIYNNADMLSLASTLPLQSGSQTNINFSLGIAGTVSGRVTRATDGAGLPGIQIRASRVAESLTFIRADKYTVTNESGNYMLTGLPVAAFFVETTNANAFGYANQVFQGGTFYTRTPVPVSAGSSTQNIDFGLSPGGIISGRITNVSGGTGLQSASVTASSSDWDSVYFASTNSSGYYSLLGLLPGAYYIQASFSGLSGSTALRSEYYSGSVSRRTARTIMVAQSENNDNGNIALSPIQKGSISGKVTRDLNGTGVVGVQVRAYKGSSYLSSTTLNSNGDYTISNLEPGNYYVATYNAPGLVDEYYDNASSQSTAAVVAVTAGATTPNINLSLAAGGSISGKVARASNGQGIPRAPVAVYDLAWNLVRAGSADLSGNYTIGGLASGSYYVATNHVPNFDERYYDNALSKASALAVQVSIGITTQNVNLALQPALALNGSVNSEFSVPLPGATVTLYDNDWQAVASASTDSTGAFYIEGLQPGEYYMEASGVPGYVGEYHHNSFQQSSANIIHLIEDPYSVTFTLTPTTPAAADFDKDRKSDITVWRPESGMWYTIPSTAGGYTQTQWGLPSDAPAPADYDADGQTDAAVWRPSSGTWFILPSESPGTYIATRWGVETDKPIPADYDGDGKADVAVWRHNGTWFVLPSNTPGSYTDTKWGVLGDVPVAADYDGDGKADVAVWRPSSGTWFILPSESPGTYIVTQWGVETDKPIPADYDGDGKADVAVWRPNDGNWFVLPSSTPAGYTATQWGVSTDIPVAGDYDGDGTVDIAVWRPDSGIWFIMNSGSHGSYTAIQWGMATDKPITQVP